MTGVQTCALPICFPVTIKKGELARKRAEHNDCGEGSCSPEDEATQARIQREIDILEEDVKKLEKELTATETPAKPAEPVTPEQIAAAQKDIDAKKSELARKRAEHNDCGEGSCSPEDEATQARIQREIDILEDDVKQLEKKQADLTKKKGEQDKALAAKSEDPEYISKKINQQSFTECLGDGSKKLRFDPDLPSQEIRLGRICAPKSGETKNSRPDDPNDRLCSQYVQCHDGTLRYTVCACSIIQVPVKNDKELDQLVRKCVSDGIGTVQVGDDPDTDTDGWYKKNYEYFIKKSTGTQK